MLKVTIKNMYCCFCQKLSTLSSLITGVLGKRCEGKAGEGSLNKWNQGETIEIS